MKYKIVTTEQADSDLRAIYEYIAFTLLSPEAAVRQLERIEQSIMKLQEMPERYQLYEEEPWRSRGLRSMPADHFIVFYIPRHEEDKTITVIRVLYGGRNRSEQLADYDKKQSTAKLIDDLNRDRKSGKENGWILHEA
ncbi:type II toxin-antitoxin system RelE/ParE family toxin [Acetonema longum]|uniref:Addiction module toxin, RelE/StbE family protein n=1 Tax=Acetonema longum DSM 6540 TaxID=1009370 RepID=F7NP70_9FIRM|nr:type II toxin-antitoxin system RelE/ParE family toxin [Acetonema longum]EGO62193.1 addiction module toxin, RelE/StbE family protein [Acetonema longum DSM 6540]